MCIALRGASGGFLRRHILSSFRSILPVTCALFLLDCGNQGGHRAEVDQAVKPIMEGQWTTAVVVGLLTASGTEVHAYGSVTPGGPPPDALTMFEIGSITKTFTSLALASMVEGGEVSLGEPVQDLLGPSPVLPTRNGKAIALEHLATHTSGLPRMPTNFSPADPANPYADYGAPALDAFLGGYVLPVDPGAVYQYSNVGMGLLGRALGLRAGSSYADLVRARVTEPLGLADTTIALAPDQASRFAQGHDGDLNAVPAWTFDVLAGAGSLRSTANDLLRYVSAQVGRESSPLAPAISLTHVPRFDIDAQTASGLAWLLTGGRYAWHDGGTGGCESFVGFDLATRTGVVVLSSAFSSFQPATQVGLALLTAVAGQGMGTVILPPLVPVAPAVLDAHVGRYRFADPASGLPVDLLVDRDGSWLRSTLPGRPGHVRLYPASETVFFVRAAEVPIRVTFQPATAAAPASVLIEPYGQGSISAVRVP